MVRKLETLGLGLVVVFALSGVGAQVAQAAIGKFSFEINTNMLIGNTDATEPSNVVKINPGALNVEFTCNEVSWEASVTPGETSTITAQEIVYGDTGLTATKGANVCTSSLGVNAPVKFNGCDYRFTAGETVGEKEAGVTEGTVDIFCPEGKEIEFQAVGCFTKIPPQENIGPVFYRTVKVGGKPEHLTIEAKIGEGEGMEHNRAIFYSTSGAMCGVHNGETGGIYIGNFTVKGYNTAALPQENLTVT